MQDPHSNSRKPWRDNIKGLIALWSEYTLFTRAVTVALVGVALMNIAIAYAGPSACLWEPLCFLPSNLQSALASDGAVTLLTLSIALAVGVHLKVRARQGLLDGSEHYDIGRALAYGYFVNFLVPALLLVRNESRKQTTSSAPPLRLWVVFPSTVGELNQFKSAVEPMIRERTRTQELQGVYQTGGTVIQRSLLVVSKQPSEAESGSDCYFDFPTTLYTLHDYYAMWNAWQIEHKRTVIDDAVMQEDEQRQMNVFFTQLQSLFNTSVGLQGVSHLGIGSVAELSALYTDHFQRVAPEKLLALLSDSVAA